MFSFSASINTESTELRKINRKKFGFWCVFSLSFLLDKTLSFGMKHIIQSLVCLLVIFFLFLYTNHRDNAYIQFTICHCLMGKVQEKDRAKTLSERKYFVLISYTQRDACLLQWQHLKMPCKNSLTSYTLVCLTVFVVVVVYFGVSVLCRTRKKALIESLSVKLNRFSFNVHIQNHVVCICVCAENSHSLNEFDVQHKYGSEAVKVSLLSASVLLVIVVVVVAFIILFYFSLSLFLQKLAFHFISFQPYNLSMCHAICWYL